MRYYLTLIFLLFCSLLLPVFGQSDYLPIQNGDKWGYINVVGKVVITPQYDLAHTFNNGAAKVQKNGKSFLIDKQGNRISPVGIDDFRHLANRIIFTKAQFVGMCNYQGAIIIEPVYGSIQETAVPGIFLVGKGNSFGLMDTSGNVLTPCTSKHIQFISNIFWCQNNTKTVEYCFYIPSKHTYLDGNYSGHLALGIYDLVYRDKAWFVAENQDSTLANGWEDVSLINSTYFIGSNKKDTTLYAIEGLTPIAHNFGFVEDYDANRMILNDENIRHIVIGTDYYNTKYGYVNLLENGSFYVRWNGMANYLDSVLNPKFSWKYSDIQPIDSSFVKVYTDAGVGLLSLTINKEIIAPRFSSLTIYDGRVKAFSYTNSLWLFSVVPEGATDSMEFTNHASVKSYSLSISRNADVLNPLDTGINRQGRWFIENRRWGYIGNNGKILIKPFYSSYSQVPGTPFTIVEYKSYSPRTNALVSIRYGIINEVNGELLVYPNCTYIDRSMLADPSFSVVRVRKQSGVFDLLDKGSGKSKRLISPFIDGFVNGRARIYIGGSLSYIESPETPHIKLAKEFTAEYGYSLGTGFTRLQRYVRSKYKSSVLKVYAVKGQWNYVDQNGNLLLPVYKYPISQVTYAQSFDPENAVVYHSDSCALINRTGDYLTPYKYKAIKKVTDSTDSYYKVTRKSSSFSYYNKMGQKIGDAFEYGSDFNQGAAWVRINNGFFILRENGSIVSPMKQGIPYRHKFNDGLSPIEVRRSWTLVDTNGQFLFKPKTGKITWTSEGFYAQRKTKQNKKGRRTRGYEISDRNGNPITSQLFRYCKPFKNGYAEVRLLNSKTAFIDTLGNIIIQKKYQHTWEFDSNGYCKVRKGNIGVISNEGKTIVPTRFGKVFVSDSAIIAGSGNHVVVFNHQGKRLASHRHVERFGGFNNGIAMIRQKNKVGYVDLTGKWTIQPVYFSGTDFADQTALVRNRSGQYIINSDAHILASFPYKERIDFSEGILIRKTGVGYQYFNRYGILITPKQYEKARPFKNGVAIVMEQGKMGLINKEGDEILPCEYSTIRINEMGEITANKSQTYGLVDNKGKEVVPPTFDDISYKADHQLYTLKDGFIPSYLTESGDWLWQPNMLTRK